MADSNDTGSGGINLDGDLYTFDVVERNSSEDSNGGKQGTWSPGSVNVDKKIKDISKPTRETFAKYLSKTTLAKPGSSIDVPARPNAYPVGADDATLLQEVSLRDVDGNPIRPSASPNESKFSPEFNQTMGAPAPLPLRKGYSIDPVDSNSTEAESNPDGNSLLRNAAIPADPDPNTYIKNSKGLSDPINSYVTSVLVNNRFNPVVDNKQFIPNYLSAISLKAVATEQYDANSSFVRPDELRFGASAGNDDVLRRGYGFKRLARIAPILQKNATFLNQANSSNDSSSENPENSNSSAEGGNFSATGDLSLPIERINVESIIRDLTEDIIQPEQITDFGSKFETVLNNLVDRFSGLNTESQIAIATALISAVFKAYEVVDSQVGNANLPAGKSRRYGKGGGGRQGIGTYFGGPTAPANLNDFIKIMSDQTMAAKKLEFLNIRATSRPFREAVLRGMYTFFNADPNVAQPFVSVLRPTKNTNYNIVLARSIVRASTRLALLLKEINDSQGLNSEEKTYESFLIMRNSRLIGIFNFFAHIGDIGLESTDAALPLYNVTVDDLDAGRKVSLTDSLSDLYNPGKDNFSAKYGKSRLFQGKVRKLAWGINQTPDFLLGPAKADLNLRVDFKAGSGYIKSIQDPTTPTRIHMQNLGEITPRFSTADRLKMEQMFEAEYVPFYFHDLRTNELLGFHCFLLSLSEDYAANYESIDGYGRVEPIKIYKNTQRKMSFSFIAAATDSAEFDTFWYKINKLVTMVYPQYTTGKKVTDQNQRFSFVKPFTQQISASPMVRIRLGNLFKSNYSKFNLARIFGLNEPDTILEGLDRDGTIARSLAESSKENKQAVAVQNNKAAQGKADQATENREKIIKDKFSAEYTYNTGTEPGSGYDAIKEEAAPKPANNDLAGKANEAIEKEKEKKTKQIWKAIEKDNKKDTSTLPEPYRNYYLVCKVEAVLDDAEGARATAAAGAPRNEFTFSDYDPAKEYKPGTIFRCEFRKQTKSEFMDELDLYQPIEKDPPEGEGNTAQTQAQKATVEKARKEMEIKYTAGQARYDKEVLAFRIPDVTKHKFLVSIEDLDIMSATSKKLYDTKVVTAQKDEETAKAEATKANEQQAIEDQEAQKEYEERMKEIPATPEEAAQKFSERAKTFMRSENNSIVRSFNSAGGQGLAGFIESLGMDWMAGPWDTSDGRKAPMMCKITINFAPVHDISPGLDANGQNRAPVYPIGPYADSAVGV